MTPLNTPSQSTQASNNELEFRKLELEQLKARWSAISVIVPIIVALGTIIYGVWSFHATAKLQFETKIAELAMQNFENFPDILNRAELLTVMFGNQLPHDFVKNVRETDLGKLSGKIRDPAYAPKIQLLTMLASAKSNNRAFIIDAYRKLFPDDDFVNDILPLIDPHRKTK